MAANDTLYIRGGTYGSDGFMISETKSGTGTNYTKIAAYPSESVVYHPTVANHGWLLTDKSNVWMQDFSIDANDSSNDALKVTTSGPEVGGNIVITNMGFWGCPRGHGILSSGFDKRKSLLISHCNFQTNGWNGQSPDNPLHQVYVQDSNVTVEFCYIYGITNTLGGGMGIQMNSADCTNQVYRNNWITNCTDRAMYVGGQRAEATIYNNISVNCLGGFELQYLTNSRVLNNTFYNTRSAVVINTCTNSTVQNNLATESFPDSRGVFYITGSSSVTVQNNLSCSNNATRFDYKTNSNNGSITYSGNLFAVTQWQTNQSYNAKFVSASTYDFRLQSGSSAENTGKYQSLFNTDYSGALRTGAWDIGAYNVGGIIVRANNLTKR